MFTLCSSLVYCSPHLPILQFWIVCLFIQHDNSVVLACLWFKRKCRSAREFPHAMVDIPGYAILLVIVCREFDRLVRSDLQRILQPLNYCVFIMFVLVIIYRRER